MAYNAYMPSLRKELLGSGELCDPSRRVRLISQHQRFVLGLQFVALLVLLWPEWARLSLNHFGKLRPFRDLARDRLLSSRSLCLPLPLPQPWLLLLRCLKMSLPDCQAASQVTNSHNTATATKKVARVAAVYIAKKTSAEMSKKRRSALLLFAGIKPPDSPSAYGGRLG